MKFTAKVTKMEVTENKADMVNFHLQRINPETRKPEYFTYAAVQAKANEFAIGEIVTVNIIRTTTLREVVVIDSSAIDGEAPIIDAEEVTDENR